jgi:hypothetical protein
MKKHITEGIALNDLTNRIADWMIKAITIVLVLTINSCTHSYYIAKGPNVPLFTEKNEFHGSISVGGGEMSSSTDVQAAYAISGHFGVMADFMSSSGNNYNNKNISKSKYFDGALGYFKPFDKYMVFEVYGGIGTDHQEHVYYSTDWTSGRTNLDGNADIHYTKSFLQPSIGATFKAFDIAFTTGITRLDYRIEKNTVIKASPHAAELILIAEESNPVLFEPAMTIRGGWKNVKIQLQYVYSHNLSTTEMYQDKSKFSFGIYFSIAKKYEKDVQTK